MENTNTEEGFEEFGTASLERKYDGPKFSQLRTPDPKKNEEITEYICRLLPPMKSLKNDPLGWRVYYGKHFGHYGNSSRNPEKPRARPFGCISQRNPRTREIEVECPKCNQIEVMRGKQKKREEEILAANSHLNTIENEKEREKALRELCRPDKVYATYNEWLKKHNCDRKWWMNVMTFSGTFEGFGISHTTMKNQLEPKLKEWRDKKKIDALHPTKGAWLRFTRTGVRPRVTDSVELFMETVERDGEVVDRVRFAPLTKDLITRALKECPDLGKDVVTYLSSEKIEALIASNGDLDKVDEIWDGPKKTKAVTALNSLEDASDEVNGDESVEASSLESAVTAPVVSDVDAEEAALEAQMKALKEKKAAKAKASSVSITAAAVASTATETAEDFLATFGAK